MTEALVRCVHSALRPPAAFAGFDEVFAQRISEADGFYAELQRRIAGADERNVQRQALVLTCNS